MNATFFRPLFEKKIRPLNFKANLQMCLKKEKHEHGNVLCKRTPKLRK